MTRTLFFLLAVFGLLVPAYGQGMTYGRGVVLPPRYPQQGKGKNRGPKLDKFEADGTVAGVARGKVMLQTITNQKWLIHFTPQTTVFVQGKAEADFLRPGLCVQFNAEINKQGRAQEKITYLVITTPTLTNPLGCRPEAAMGMAVAGVGPPGAGVAPLPAAPRAKPAASQRYTVHGQISKLINGRMTIVAPGTKVEAELDENAQIDVAMGDASVAKVGDRITVKGGMPPGMGAMRPGAIGNAQANEVTIELLKPLTNPNKKPVRKPPAKKPVDRRKPEPKDGAKPAPKDGAKPAAKPPARPPRKPVVPVEDEEPFKAPKKK